eukprot:tig00001030_g6468.t1
MATAAGAPQASGLYHLKFQSRCISAVVGDTDNNKFLVGTLNLREENEVHLLQFNEDVNEVRCERVYSHQHEIWDIAPCPSDAGLFFTCYNTGSETKAGLWKLTEGGHDGDVNQPLQPRCTLDPKGEFLRGVLWNPVRTEYVVTIDEGNVRMWGLGANKSTPTESSSVQPPKGQKLWCGTWDPHHTDQIATACDTAVRTWDLRSMKAAAAVEQAHSVCVRSVDYNPNRPWILCSAGDDGLIKFFDLRKPAAPLNSLRAHSHWAWGVRYNRIHDQLLLSCSTDCVVSLWKALSVSSTPSGSIEPQQEEALTPPKQSDGLVCKYEHHDESVYSIAWGAADAWLFASVSYDGRVVVNHVPQAEKYKILST